MSRIAVISNTSWNIINFRMGLLKAFKSKGHDVFAIAPIDDFSTQIEEDGVQYIPLKQFDRTGTNPVNDLKLLFELRSIMKTHKIDLILNYTIKPVLYGSFAAKSSNTLVINTLTGLGSSYLSKGFVHELVDKLYKYALKISSAVIFQNNDDLKLFLDKGFIKKEKTFLIPGSGINTEYFVPVENKSESETINFYFIGRLLIDKGIKEFVAAAKLTNKRFPNTTFNIVGPANTLNPSSIKSEHLDQWVKNDYINYHGEVKDTRPSISNSDVVVLPSYREGLPRVLLEAMSMSKPIIATDVPGCRQTTVDGTNGFLCKVKDEVSLSDTMIKMIEIGEEKRKRMGKEGRKMALEIFDEKIVINKYLGHVDKILNNRQ